MDDFLERITVDQPLLKAGSSIDCPNCGTITRPIDIDLYKCPKCGKEVDMIEDEDSY